jgi:hypothetical protein
MFTLSWDSIKSAIVYGLLWAILAIALYMIQVGDVFALNIKELVNAGVFGFLGIFVSLIKNLLTTQDGKFLGVTTVVPDKTEVV